ncbi:c-type cytochrome [Neolewinella persica]|uniref:c-type cytochrome n=1 Tax=Neolewinella persica TaxID=70998 RepID=UPI000367F613|nr:hypothetical protein [Neolewinella persica]
MKFHVHHFAAAALLLLLFIAACTTDPIIPAGGIIEDPPVEDPAETNPCPEGVVSFQFEILPIMVSACGYSACHDRASHREGVILVDYESIRREVRPGDAGRSDLYKSITEDPNDEDFMPERPAAPLTSEQTDLIRDWINQGAENTDCGIPCDPTQTSFSEDIFPILKDYCVGCHGNNREDGGVNLSSHAEILASVNNGSLIGAMKREISFAPMPPLGSFVSSCRIAQIENWIAAGAPNN